MWLAFEMEADIMHSNLQTTWNNSSEKYLSASPSINLNEL